MKAQLIQQDKTIARQPKLVAHRAAFLARNAKLFGPSKVVAAERTIAGKLAKPGEARPKSKVTMVGEAPDGFGKTVLWDPSDGDLALIVFLSAADPLGVMISGVKKTDSIEFVQAAGLASFAEDTENEGVGAFIGLVAAGSKATATAFGAPQAVPIIDAAAEFAKSRFKEKQVRTKCRDPFGVDPASGHKARQEGGLLISMPEAGQNFYSGNGDHKERWIKEPGTRDDAHRPAHVKNAFFLRTGRDTRTATRDGDLTIYAWDHAFADNFGFYRLHILMHRGSGTIPPVE